MVKALSHILKEGTLLKPALATANQARSGHKKSPHHQTRLKRQQILKTLIYCDSRLSTYEGRVLIIP